MDEIAMDGDDRIDLKQCGVAIEKEIEGVNRPDLTLQSRRTGSGFI
jgi:hypothetical protein